VGAGRDEAAEVLLVCSPGGHMLELYALREAWRGFSRAWVTMDYSDTRSLLRGEKVFYAHMQVPRSVRGLLANLLLAWSVLGRVRPKVIVTTGAAVAVPFAWIGRLRGARIVYIESATRIQTPSLSCRLIAPIAARIYVQWPELLPTVPRAQYAGSVFSSEQ
jgi:beta-1,4-N-acetylglucosaminyltransferase